MSQIKSQIESLLFISAKQMSIKQLAGLLKTKDKEVKEAGDSLVSEYQENKKGIQIIKNGSKFQMVSSPENTKVVQEFIQDETTGELSRPSLETLTIIAYRGPIAKTQLDRIRGVNCSLILRNLLMRGLVEAKVDKVREETYYTVTIDFIRYLGISDLKELPDFERLSQDDTIDRVLGESKAAEAVETLRNEESMDTDNENNTKDPHSAEASQDKKEEEIDDEDKEESEEFADEIDEEEEEEES